MDASPTYLGLDLVEVRPLNRLERLEFETRRDRSRRVVRRRWTRWGLILAGFVAYIAAIGFLDLKGNWVQGPLQIGLPFLLAYEAAHRGLARGEDDESVAIYRGVRDDSFKAHWARAKIQTGLPKRLGETVELAVLLPSGRLWSVDGFRVRGVLVPITKLPAPPPLDEEEARPLTAEEAGELRLWAAACLDSAQRLGTGLFFVVLFVGGFAWGLSLGVLPCAIFALILLALSVPVFRIGLFSRRVRRALDAPRLRALTASPGGKGPTVPMTVVEGTGLPWTIEGRPAPWRYGGQPKRVKEPLPARQDG